MNIDRKTIYVSLITLLLIIISVLFFFFEDLIVPAGRRINLNVKGTGTISPQK